MNTSKHTIQQDRNFTSLHRFLSFAGGLLLIGHGIKKGSLVKTAIGGYLAYKGFAGDRTFKEVCKAVNRAATGKAINIRTSMVINKPRREVYAAWRNLSNLSRFMQHLLKVEEGENNKSYWEMQLPAGLGPVRWTAEMVKEREGELLAWQSVSNSVLQHAGKVEFSDALGKKATAVDIVFSYHAPLGKAGEKVAGLFTPVFTKMIRADVRGFKDFMEAGKSHSDKVIAVP